MAASAPNFNNALFQPGRALSGQALYKAAVALANQQTQPTVDALRGQIGQNDQQTKNALGQTGGFFNQLGQQAQGAVGQEGQIGGDLNSRLAGIGADTQAQLRGIGQNATDSLLKYAPQSDASNSLASPALQALTAQIARTQGLAAQDEGAFRAAGASQGANYQGLASANRGAFAQRGQEALRGIAQAGIVKNEPLSNRLASVLSQKGALTATDLGKLRQQEVANRFTAQGLGLKQQQVQTVAANDAARNALTARGQNLTSQSNQARINATIRGQDLAHLDRQSALAVRVAAQRLRSGSGGAKPLSTYQNDKTLGVLGKLISAIPTLQQQGIKNAKGDVLVAHPSEQQIRAQLNRSDPLGGILTQAAYELQGYGKVSEATARALHAAGIRGGTFRGAPIGVSHPSVGGAVQGVQNFFSGI